MSSKMQEYVASENSFFKNELNFLEREQKQMDKYNAKQCFDCNYMSILEGEND